MATQVSRWRIARATRAGSQLQPRKPNSIRQRDITAIGRASWSPAKRIVSALITRLSYNKKRQPPGCRWFIAYATSGFTLGYEAQCDTVVAPALARGLRAILEQVAVMSAALGAVIFGARQYEFVIGF